MARERYESTRYAVGYIPDAGLPGAEGFMNAMLRVARHSLLGSLVLAVLGLGLAACGGSSGGAASQQHSRHLSLRPTAANESAAPADYAKVDADRDNDIGAPYDDTNNRRELDFGREASVSEKRTITALIKRYYAVALAENGAKACGMIYSTISESIPEDFGTSPPGPPYMHGKTCPVAMTGLFKHFHAQLAVEVPKLKVVRLRLEEHHGVALLSFGALPERKISFAREGHVWRMNELLDGELQ